MIAPRMDPRERAERDADARRRDNPPARGLHGDEEVARGYARKIAAFVEPIVAQWPCRTGCGATIGMTKSAVDAAKSSAKVLGIQFDQHRVMLCGTCREREVPRGPAQRHLALGATTTTTKPRNAL